MPPAASSEPRFSRAVPTLATQPYSHTHKLSLIGSFFGYEHYLGKKTSHLDPHCPPRKTLTSGSAAEPEKYGSSGKFSKPRYEPWRSGRHRGVAGPGSGAKRTAAGWRAAVEARLSGSVPPLRPWPAATREQSLSPGVPPFLLPLCSHVGLRQSHDALNRARRTTSSRATSLSFCAPSVTLRGWHLAATLSA